MHDARLFHIWNKQTTNKNERVEKEDEKIKKKNRKPNLRPTFNSIT